MGTQPVLFRAPYEAAARAIIGHGLAARMAASIHARIAAEHGEPVTVGDRPMHGFPAPTELARLPAPRGLA